MTPREALIADLTALILEQTEKTLGGHAVMCVGYDDASQRFIVMNSWGTTWGAKGFFTIPYAYISDSNLADDLWTVRVVEG